MDYQYLSSRAVIGMFYARLHADLGASWIPQVAMPFDSDQPSETYDWLGQVPAMREWVGGRQPKGLTENKITIANKRYEATLDIARRDLRLDKTGQLRVRIGEQARRANSHWAALLSTLQLNGATTLCYDGGYFFTTTHNEGSSGTQSNKISIDISALPANVHGSITAPSIEEMQQCILQAIAAIVGFVDDQGEPMNEDATSFLVQVPISLWQVALSAVALPNIAANVNNVLQANANDISIKVAPNARLSTWTSTFAVYRTDAEVKPFIKQEEEPVVMSAKAEGSEYEFDTDRHQYGISATRNVGYGFWQEACQVIMT